MKDQRNFFKSGFLLGILLFFINQLSFSQQPAYFILGEKEFEGIQIYDVIQDNENTYWFATDQGFFKYDNYTFEQLTCKDMKGTSAFGFVKNNKGIIYCYNLNKQIIKIENGICSVFYELKDDEFSSDICLSATKEDELLVYAKIAFVLNSNGRRKKTMIPDFNYYGFPFAVSENKVISHIANSNTLLVYDGTDFSYQSLVSNDTKVNGVLRFFESNNSVYAVSTGDKQFYIYKSENNEIIPFIRFDELNVKEFYRFYDLDGSLWAAGTLSGVYYLGSDKNSFSIEGKYYKDHLISDVFKDNEGNLLLSTFNFGVLVVPSLAIPDVLPFEGIKNPVSIEFDKELGILCGTIKGELWQLHPSGNKIINKGGSRAVQSVFSFDEFPYIIYDDGKLKALHRKTGKSIELANVSLKDAVFVDDRTIYVALNRGAGKLFIEKEEIKIERVDEIDLRTHSISKDRKGNLFFGTSEGLKMLGNNGEIVNLYINDKSIFANDICFYSDKIVVATKGEGILLFDENRPKKSIIPKWKNQENEILKIEIYNDKFYVLTSKGFFILDSNGAVFCQLNKVHGFSTQRIFEFEIRNGMLWLIHSKGIHKIDIKLLQDDIIKPSIYLNSFFVNDSKIELSKQNSFDFQSRDFRFKFSSPTLKNKENIRYHFKLDGYDTEWQIKDYFSNEISYNALAPGEYTFRVKAENQGVFSAEISYSFTIVGPFYYSWWFILLITGGIVAAVVLFYRRKLRNQKRKAEIINEMNASRLAAIQSQMNPHFIFNSMNAIQDLVLKGDIDNSYTFITKFSDLVRHTLDYSGKDFIEFEQELKLIQLYLSLEKLRFKDQLIYSVQTDEMEDVLVPPMLIQPFIENAILHGLLHKEGEKILKIKFELKDTLICTIEDNGIGRKASQEIKSRQRADHESFSGKAIKKRFEILKDIFGEDLGFYYEDLIENEEATGTKVILKIPVKHKF